MSRQQAVDVVARMRMDRILREPQPEDWRERRDDWGDHIADLEARDRAAERADDPITHLDVTAAPVRGHAG